AVAALRAFEHVPFLGNPGGETAAWVGALQAGINVAKGELAKVAQQYRDNTASTDALYNAGNKLADSLIGIHIAGESAAKTNLALNRAHTDGAGAADKNAAATEKLV